MPHTPHTLPLLGFPLHWVPGMHHPWISSQYVATWICSWIACGMAPEQFGWFPAEDMLWGSIGTVPLPCWSGPLVPLSRPDVSAAYPHDPTNNSTHHAKGISTHKVISLQYCCIRLRSEYSENSSTLRWHFSTSMITFSCFSVSSFSPFTYNTVAKDS